MEIVPQVFVMHDDGLAYVKNIDETGFINGEPRLKGQGGLADVPDDLLEAVQEAADECPGDCIYIESASNDYAGGTV